MPKSNRYSAGNSKGGVSAPKGQVGGTDRSSGEKRKAKNRTGNDRQAGKIR